MRFPFQKRTNQGSNAFMPYIPVQLYIDAQTIQVFGLLDTGATINVMPYALGIQLGANWESQNIPLQLGGNLAKVEARALFVNVLIEGYEKVELAFAWSKSDNVPLILGQTNFFMEFDVLFSRASLYFEVFKKGTFDEKY
jgi:hypothetical protein